MANLLKMAIVQSILSLFAQGWSQRRIARELDVDRETVGKYVRQRLCGAKPANAPTGSEGSKPATLPAAPGTSHETGNAPTGAWDGSAGPPPPANPARTPTGASGPRSQCEPYREQILAGVEAGLSARRIHQDLSEQGAAVHYDSLRRFIRRWTGSRPLPFRRIETPAGEEAQVDFGSGARVVGEDGRRRKTHVFRIVLSHSRKAYSEVTYRQTTDDFLRALETPSATSAACPARWSSTTSRRQWPIPTGSIPN